MADLSVCSIDELGVVIDQARARLKELDFRGRSQLRDRIVAMILNEGFMPEDVFEELAVRSEHAAKYQHPRYRFLQWSGEGKSPRWFLDLLAYGYTKERLRVAQAAPAPNWPALQERRTSGKPNLTGLFADVERLRMAARRRRMNRASPQV